MAVEVPKRSIFISLSFLIILNMVQAMYSLHGANSMPRFPNMQKQYLNADKIGSNAEPASDIGPRN